MDSFINNVNTITFPCIDKIPLIKEWNKLNIKIPHDKKQNYGILTGQINDLTIIDCDILKQNDDSNKYMCGVEAWNKLCEVNTFFKRLEIPMVKTQSGGLHLYFKYCPELKAGIQKLKSNNIFLDNSNKIIKIDILSNNKFVIGPGSKRYKFTNNSQYYQPPIIPTQLIEIFTYQELEQSSTLQVNNSGHYNIITENSLKYIVDGIPKEYADNYQEWIKVIWAIADTSNKHNINNGLEIANNFSSLSSKYNCINEVERIYNQSNGQITFGTLVHLSKNKINLSNEKLYRGVNLTNTEEIIKDLNSIDLLFNSISSIINIKYDGLIADIECQLISQDDNNIQIQINNKNLSIMQNINGNYTFIGHLKKQLEFKDDVTPIHKDFNENGGDIYHMNQNRTDLVSKGQYGENRIKYLKSGKQKSIITMVNGKQTGIKRSKKDIEFLEDVIQKSCKEHLSNYNIINVKDNVFNINIYNNNDEDNIRSDDRIIEDLIKSHPAILDQFKFCSNEYSNFNGIYIYGPQTGIWRKEHNSTVNKMLTSRIKKYVPMLNEKEIKYCETQKNKSGLRMSFVEQIIDNNFESKIDESLDIFAMNNCVFDLRIKSLRKATPYDFVYTNTGWDYNESEAEKYYNDVCDFFNKLFPLEDEREVVLTYLASLLHGYRTDKKLLAFTDKRNGNNGKTTLMTLLRTFFGDYTETNNCFFLKSNFGKDKDSHDGGTVSLKGKRLLISDELKKHHRLDEGTVKNITGGANQEIQGRRMGKEEFFKFLIQCGVIIIFNEGDCPKFDATDIAFIERFLLVPFRSIFIKAEGDNDFNTFTFKKDPNISDKFKLWRSALLKLFIKYTRKEGILNMQIPDTMSEWKNEIISENNELKDWLFSVITEGTKTDFVSLNGLVIKYKSEHPYEKRLKNKEIERMINCLFNTKGIYMKEQYKRSCEDEL